MKKLFIYFFWRNLVFKMKLEYLFKAKNLFLKKKIQTKINLKRIRKNIIDRFFSWKLDLCFFLKKKPLEVKENRFENAERNFAEN